MDKNKNDRDDNKSGDTTQFKLIAPGMDGEMDREVVVIYQRPAIYGRPSFLKSLDSKYENSFGIAGR